MFVVVSLFKMLRERKIFDAAGGKELFFAAGWKSSGYF